MRAPALTMLIAAFLATPASSAARRPSALGVCEVMERIDHYRGRTVEMTGHLRVGNHGVHLLEPGCKYEINLSWRGRTAGGLRLRRIVDRYRTHPMMMRVRVKGKVKAVESRRGPHGEENRLALGGPWVEVDEARVISLRRLSESDEHRYHDWLGDKKGRPFHPGPEPDPPGD